MKKKISILLILIAVFTLVACGKKEEGNVVVNNNTPNEAQTEAGNNTASESDTPTIDSIKSKGELVIATCADYPPYEWHLIKDGKDEIVGFDIAIAEEIAKALDVELKLIDMNFEGILPSLVSGDSDMAIGGLVPSEERKKEVDFTDIYYETTQVMLVRKEDEQSLNNMDAYKGKTIGAQLSSTQEDLAKEKFPDSQVFTLSKLNDLVLELQNKNVDSILMVEPAAVQYAKVSDDLVVVNIGLPDHDGAAIAVGKGKEDLLKFTNDLLKKLIEEGKVDAYVEEYTKLSNEES